MKSEMIGVSMSHEMYETICKLAEENSISKAAQVKILVKKGLENNRELDNQDSPTKAAQTRILIKKGRKHNG